MDFLQQFLQIALSRMTSGNTSAQTDTGGFSSPFGTDSVESVKRIYDNTQDTNLTGRQKWQRTAEGIGKLVGDWYTGGRVSPITNALEDKYPGLRDKMETMELQVNPLNRLFGHLFEGKGGKGLSFM